MGEIGGAKSYFFKYRVPTFFPSFRFLLFEGQLLLRQQLLTRHDTMASESADRRIGMFAPKQLPLQGNEYLTRFRDLSQRARTSCGRLRRLWHVMAPAPWLDKLTKDQETYYHFVATPEEWVRIKNIVAEEVAEFPAITVSIIMQGTQARPAFLTFGTQYGRVVTLSLLALAHNVQGWFREEELLPEDLLVWLRQPEYFVIVAGQAANFFKNPPDGYRATSIVNTEDMFALYQSAGVIRPNIVPKVGDLSYQMTYSYGYHHLPSSRETFLSMIGEDKYDVWPVYRQMGWKPFSAHGDLQPEEAFFHYYEGAGPWAFVLRLAIHGIIYDGLQAVQKELPYHELLAVFLRANLADADERTAADPLSLLSDCGEQASAAPAVVVEQNIPKYSPEPRDNQFTNYSPTPLSRPGEVSTKKPEKDRWHPKFSPIRAPAVDTVTEDDDDIIIQDGELEEWASQTQQVGSAEEQTSSVERMETELGEGHSTSQSENDNRTPVKDRLGEREEPRAGPSGQKGKTAVTPPKESGLPSGWEHDPADLRSRLLLIAHKFALEEKRGEEGVVPAKQDLNTQFRSRQINRKDKDPLLLKMAGRLPFWENSFLKREPGFKVSKSILGYDILTKEEQEANPFVDKPRFHRQCEFCSSQHCSKYARGSEVEICLKFKEHNRAAPTRDECLYLRCTDRKTHHVPVCPSLHSRCTKCGLRGHGPHDLCDLNNPDAMERLRADFEHWATIGTLTKGRKDTVEWGFYKFSKKAVAGDKPPIDYIELTEMNVLDALATVEALNLAADLESDGETGASDPNNNNNKHKTPPAKKRRLE